MDAVESLPIEPDLPSDPPDAYVEALVRRAGTSFFWGMRRLAEDRRRGIFAVYGFCRDVDDIADGDLPLQRKSALLDIWRVEVDRIYDATPTHPIGQALVGPVRQFELKKEDFLAVIDGMEMDARPRVRIADRTELALYCDRVASAVGRLCTRIFGMSEAEGIALSAALGEAMQVTNILRDITEDAARDRVYLPADMLQVAGAGGDGIEDILTAPGLPVLCDELAEHAALRFDEAAKIMASADRRTVRPARMMMAVYHRILVKLRRRGWYDLNSDVGPGKAEKIMIALRFGLFG